MNLQKMDFSIILQNQSVQLRPMEITDFEAYKSLAKDAEMWQYFTSDLSDETELRAWINTAVEQTKTQKRLAFSVLDSQTNQIIGSTSFGNISPRDKRAEIGWTWIGKPFQGKGYNANMKFLMMEYCFEILDFERVEIKTDVLNIPARKAVQKIGMVEEGVLRSHTQMINNRRRDTIFYSVLKNEWQNVKRNFLKL